MDMLIKKDTLNKISDKIRQRLNVEEHYSVLQMPNKAKEAFASNYSTEILRDFIERSATQYIIPNGVTSIGYSAFEAYTSLTSITIPSSVTNIGGKAFYNCTGLTSVEIPDSVTSIGNLAFYNCESLTSITIPNSVTSIGNGTFSECSGLTTINVPWAEGEVSGAPWGATNATINYNYSG